MREYRDIVRKKRYKVKTMTVVSRRILYSVFIVLFLFCALALLLFALGFRIHWSSWALYRPGYIILESSPRPDVVKIDDATPQGTGNPIRFSGIEPGTHRIHIEKEGYLTSTLTVFVRSGITTSLGKIQLIRQANDVLLQKDVSLAVPSPDRSSAAILSSNRRTVSWLDLNTQNTSLILEDFAYEIREIFWPPAQTRVMTIRYVHASNDRLANVFFDGRIEYLPVQIESSDRIAWGGNSPDASLYILRGSLLLRFDSTTATTTQVSDGILSWSHDGLSLIVCTTSGIIQTISERDVRKDVFSLPSGRCSSFVPSPPEFLTVFHEPSQEVFVIRKTSPNDVHTFHDVKSASWVSRRSSHALLLMNDHELSFVNEASFERTLIRRTSDTILASAWIPETDYLLCAQNDALLALQSEGNGDPLSLGSSAMHQDISALFFNKRDTAYFLASGDLRSRKIF
jgi:hypothetical protein